VANELTDKVAIITGGSQGLGAAIAGAFADAGAKLFLVARTREKLERMARELAQRASGVETLAADVSDADGAAGAVSAAADCFGQVDVLVNCAGTFLWRSFTELSAADWRNTIETNLTAPFLLTQAMASRLIKQGGGGAVINIASIHGEIADANVVPQCAAKLGLVGLTRASAEALRPHGIRVNAISPGAIEPDSPDRLSDGLQSKITQADVAQAAVYLASDQARGITGANLEAFGVTRPVVGSK
jgi:meso-butanediol dehydrogenase/(S,S)-butanediol dehydrogenase/diacetyl reductase